MAIPVLNHLDFRSCAEAQNLILHKTTEASATNTEGTLIYDTGTDTVKYRNASAWVSLTEAATATQITVADTTDTTCYVALWEAATGDLGPKSDGGLTYNAGTGMLTATGLTGPLTGNADTATTAGTVTTAAQTNITSLGTLTALTVDDIAINGKVMTMTGSSGDTATMTVGTNGTLDITTVDTAAAAANIQITADGTAELAGTTVTLDSSGGITLDADGGTITFADAGSSLGTITSSGYSGNIGGQAATVATITGLAPDTATTQATQAAITSAANLATVGTIGTGVWEATDVGIAHGGTGQSTAAAAANALLNVSQGGALTIGDGSDTITIPGDLTVTGDTTTNNVTTVTTSNGVVFEGTTADGHDATLKSIVAGADVTYTLPNKTGTVAMTSDITGTNSGTNTGDEPDADLTTKGIVELATIAETNTGTDAGRAVTPDGLDGWTGSTQVVTLGTITTGTWNATVVAATYLPDAATNAEGVVELATSAETITGTDTARVVTPDGLAARSVVAAIDISDSDFTSNLYAEITHSLGTADVMVEVYDITTEKTVYCDVERKDKSGSASTSKVTLKFSCAPTNDLRAIVTCHAGATSVTPAYA